MARRFRDRQRAALALAVVLGSGAAAANGRFPRAQQVVEQPGNPDRIWLRATYGLLTTADHGLSWQFICEKAGGYGPSEDPAIAVSGDGSLFAGTLDGLRLTRDVGCSFSLFPGALEFHYVADLTVEQLDSSRVLLLVSESDLQSGQFVNQVWRSADDGQSFEQLGGNLPGDFLGLTIDPAPSDTRRIYVSGVFSTPSDAGVRTQGAVLRSDDDGLSFQRFDVPNTGFDDAPFISAIDPKNPEILWLRVNGLTEDRLLRSSNGAASFEELLRGEAELFGFALSPDGSTVLAGFGDPRDTTLVDPQKLGVWHSGTSSIAFSRRFSEPVGCLSWTASGVYACAFQSESGFELGLSRDEARSFEPVLTQAQIGPTGVCPAGTPTAELCPLSWPSDCRMLELCDAGGGGAATDAGIGARAAGGSAGSPANAGDQEAGCGCELGERPGRNGFALALLALFGARWFNEKQRARRDQTLPPARAWR